MEVLAHRGLWHHAAEKNSLAALASALAAGFGIETDVRDLDGDLIVSHDPPRRGALPFETLLVEYRRLNARGTLALNVKSDGLTTLVQASLATYGIENYFVFDMSIPDTLHYQRAKMPFFTRQSEFEPVPALYPSASGVWLDAFQEDWYSPEAIAAHVTAGKQVCVVSPELHKRQHLLQWHCLKALSATSLSRLLICTDHPQTCCEFFR